jgi:hypothetical protein
MRAARLTQRLDADGVLLRLHAAMHLELLERRREHFAEMVSAWQHESGGGPPIAWPDKQETPGMTVPRVSTDRNPVRAESGGRYGNFAR